MLWQAACWPFSQRWTPGAAAVCRSGAELGLGPLTTAAASLIHRQRRAIVMLRCACVKQRMGSACSDVDRKGKKAAY